MNQLLKLILTGILLLCFLKMPFLFYRLSGYLLFAGFGFLAYDAFERRDQFDVKVFILLALLYNPFIGLPIPHLLMNIISVLVIIGLILNLIFSDDESYAEYKKKDDR